MRDRSHTSTGFNAGFTLAAAAVFMLFFTARSETGLVASLALTAPGLLVLAVFLFLDVRQAGDLAASGPALSSRLLAYVAVIVVALGLALALAGVRDGFVTHAAVRPAALVIVAVGVFWFRYGRSFRRSV